MKTIDLIYFNAGGGHRAAAQALQATIQAQGRPWEVRLVNLMAALDPNGLFRKMTGMAPEDYYNRRLARGWTIGLAQELKLLQAMIRFSHATLVRALQQHWLSSEPDLVVSLVPNFNRALYDSVSTSMPGVPFVTILTDMADHPPHFWIEPGQQQQLVCGTARAVEQALEAGYAPAQIARVSGMILRPGFYEHTDIDRAAGRKALGLDPDRPTGVVMFGGEGSMQMARIAAALSDVQLIVLCGRNEKLARQLRRSPTQAPHVILGFTPDVARCMRLGDFFIGKPGPGSLSEAVHCGLPPITFENAWTMPQERYNAQWVRDLDLGVVLKSTRHIESGTRQMIARLSTLRERVGRIHNRAVFEVPPILARLLNDAEVPSLPARSRESGHIDFENLGALR